MYEWFQVGAPMSLFHLVIWLGLGMVWWKLLDWWRAKERWGRPFHTRIAGWDDGLACFAPRIKY